MSQVPTTFSAPDAKRVARATRRVEQQHRLSESADYGTAVKRAGSPAFLVWLTQNGGANGTDGTAGSAAFPTYTYDVFTDAAKTRQIGTAVAVDFHRPLKVAVTAGTHGLAQWVGGTLHLIQVDEYFDRDDC